jgi:hypothetical protein
MELPLLSLRKSKRRKATVANFKSERWDRLGCAGEGCFCRHRISHTGPAFRSRYRASRVGGEESAPLGAVNIEFVVAVRKAPEAEKRYSSRLEVVETTRLRVFGTLPLHNQPRQCPQRRLMRTALKVLAQPLRLVKAALKPRAIDPRKARLRLLDLRH